MFFYFPLLIHIEMLDIVMDSIAKAFKSTQGRHREGCQHPELALGKDSVSQTNPSEAIGDIKQLPTGRTPIASLLQRRQQRHPAIHILNNVWRDAPRLPGVYRYAKAKKSERIVVLH